MDIFVYLKCKLGTTVFFLALCYNSLFGIFLSMCSFIIFFLQVWIRRHVCMVCTWSSQIRNTSSEVSSCVTWLFSDSAVLQVSSAARVRVSASWWVRDGLRAVPAVCFRNRQHQGHHSFRKVFTLLCSLKQGIIKWEKRHAFVSYVLVGWAHSQNWQFMH